MNVLIVMILFLLVILVSLEFVLLVAINTKTKELNLLCKQHIIALIDKLFSPSLTLLENIFSFLLKIGLIFSLLLLEIPFILF